MPLSPVMQEFVNDPEAFSKKNLISPSDISLTFLGSGPANISAEPSTGATKTTVKVYESGVGNKDDLLNVHPNSRICFAEFFKGFGDDDAKNGYKVRFYPYDVLPSAKQGDFLPCWYLPYLPDRITKLTLQPEPTLAGGADPSFFFTASLSGCSVFVSGDPQHPTICHGCLSGERDDLKINGKTVPGEQYLQHLFETKTGASDYYNIDKNEYSNQSLVYQEFEKFLKDEHRGKMQVREVRDMGAVFGWRKPAGTWHIFLQRQARVTYYQILKPKGSPKSSFLGQTLSTHKEDKLAKDQHGAVESFFQDAPVAMLEIFPAGSGSGIFAKEFTPLKT